MIRKAVFLDRDGTINKNYGYVYSKEKFVFLKKAISALRFLKKKKYKIIVITNQSGIARGYYKLSDVNKLHRWINNVLKKKKTEIDKFYICSYHPKFSKKKSEKLSYFRKPNPGMIIRALKEFNLDKKKSFMIGDEERDALAAKRAGILFFKKKYNLLRTVNQGHRILKKALKKNKSCYE